MVSKIQKFNDDEIIKEFSQYEGLIHGVLTKEFHLNSNSKVDIYTYDDFYADGKIALLECIEKFNNSYDNDKSTFYYTCIKNYIATNVLRKIYRKKRKSNFQSISLNAKYDNCEDELISSVAEKSNQYEEFKIQFNIYQKLKKGQIDNIDIRIIEYLKSGYTHKEICKLLNLKKSTIRCRMENIKSVFIPKNNFVSNDDDEIIMLNIRLNNIYKFKSIYEIANKLSLNVDTIRYRLKTNSLLDSRYILFDSMESYNKWRIS